MKKRWTSYIAVFLSLAASVSAQEAGFFHVDTGVLLIKIATLILVLGSFVVIPLKKHLDDTGKKIMFAVLVVPTVIASLYFAGSIIHENLVSETGGPVHWHADYQVWVCGERLDLQNPSFPSNKIGTPLFHEHDDDRVHVEGTVMRVEDVDLGSYFSVIDGHLEDGHLEYPSTKGVVDVEDGDMCNGQSAKLEVYVNGGRVEDYENYQIYKHAYVPPGDCIIVEFDSEDKETTEKICSSWEAKGWNYDNYEEKREEGFLGGEQ